MIKDFKIGKQQCVCVCVCVRIRANDRRNFGIEQGCTNPGH